MVTKLRGREPRECRMEFRLSVSELEALEMAAFDEDCTISHLIRAALRKYLGRSQYGPQRRAARKTKKAL